MPVSKIVAQGNPPRLLVGIVLDRSSSMDSIRAETISGTNEQFDTLRKSDDAANTHVVAFSFNQKVSPIFTKKRDADGKALPELIPVADLEDLSVSNYLPSGMTAMLDGVGDCIEFLSKEARPVDDVVVVVISDGAENASQRFTSEKIASQVKELQEAGWNFTYIGANQDLTVVQQSLNLHQGNTLTWQATADGTNQAHGTLSSALASYTMTRSAVRSKGISARVSTNNLYGMKSEDDVVLTSQDQSANLNVTIKPEAAVDITVESVALTAENEKEL